MTTEEDKAPQKQDASANKKKKQERVVVKPPCPTEVATAYLVVRGAILGLLGVNPEDMLSKGSSGVSLLQPTYNSDMAQSGQMTGKFSISLGKKLGCGKLGLPEENQEEFYKTLENAMNRIVSEKCEIKVVTYETMQEAVDAHGGTIQDASHQQKKKKKPKKNNADNNKDAPPPPKPDPIIVAHVDGLICCIPPGMPFASTGDIQGISLDVAQCSISCSSKSTSTRTVKAEIVVKFQVQPKSGDKPAIATPTDTLDTTAIANLLQKEFRCIEGQELYQKQQAEEQKAAEAEAAAAAQEAAKNAAESEATTQKEEEEMVVNAFEVKGVIDYTKLVDKFGSRLITLDLLKQLEQATVGRGRVPKLHRFLRRDIFFSHRDLHVLLPSLETNGMYLYTGRGPSSTAMHLGHLVPFLMTQWLQKALDCPLVIQMTDDEKFLFKGHYEEGKGDNLLHYYNLTMENARDIIACGFDFDKTFIFSDLNYVGQMYPNIVRIWKAVTTNTVQGIFGFDGTDNIGKVAFPAIQAAPSFASSFPNVLNQKDDDDKKKDYRLRSCLIPCAIDQDPYFRMTRDIAHKLVPSGHVLGGKPALIHSKFFPPLQGARGKMSSSDENSAIFLTDTPEDIERKIKEHAYSGGQETKKLQEELGADLEQDVSYQWLRFFLEDDDELEEIARDYGSGTGKYWSTGAVKAKLITVLKELVAQHQERRAKITDEEVKKWMTERCIIVDK